MKEFRQCCATIGEGQRCPNVYPGTSNLCPEHKAEEAKFPPAIPEPIRCRIDATFVTPSIHSASICFDAESPGALTKRDVEVLIFKQLAKGRHNHFNKLEYLIPLGIKDICYHISMSQVFLVLAQYGLCHPLNRAMRAASAQFQRERIDQALDALFDNFVGSCKTHYWPDYKRIRTAQELGLVSPARWMTLLADLVSASKRHWRLSYAQQQQWLMVCALVDRGIIQRQWIPEPALLIDLGLDYLVNSPPKRILLSPRHDNLGLILLCGFAPKRHVNAWIDALLIVAELDLTSARFHQCIKTIWCMHDCFDMRLVALLYGYVDLAKSIAKSIEPIGRNQDSRLWLWYKLNFFRAGMVWTGEMPKLMLQWYARDLYGCLGSLRNASFYAALNQRTILPNFGRFLQTLDTQTRMLLANDRNIHWGALSI
jgi:hypothetical protein